MEWNIKSGVLIIGSLLWQDYTYVKGDNIRLNWRNSSLALSDKIAVKVPIRYGRLSGRRNHEIPTMIFSNKMKRKLGIGYVVPFQSPINTYNELLSQANDLSNAEGMHRVFVKNWGVLSYLINNKKINPKIKSEVIKLFRQNKNDPFNPKDYRVGREKPCITLSLKLDISWLQTLIPSEQKKLDQFDFLFATATNPENKVVSLNTIANKIMGDNDRRYFLNNISNGIITYEDFEIAKKLK